MELEPVIGLEIHIQLKTKSKMFCSCANIFGDVEPNSAICPICMGYPGTLPVPNETAIKWTQKLGAALKCELKANSKFDRKSYFYPDLPKGYQISQYDQPFCGDGAIEITLNGAVRKVGIERIHLEEDAAKNTHPAKSLLGDRGASPKKAKYTLVDYNRAGTPLAELVTKPDLRSPQEAKVFLQELQKIVRSLSVSDADMEKGQMRCDANISLREKGTVALHPKTEIKNLNSFRFVEQALVYEITRQTPIEVQSTRGFNSERGVTVEQRTKEGAADYRYFPEPDIPPFEFTAAQLHNINEAMPELPAEKTKRFVRQTGVSEQSAELLVNLPELADFFESVVSELEQLDKEEVGIAPKELPELVKIAANTILRQVREVGLKDTITAANFAELIVLVQQGKINKDVVAQILDEMKKTGGDPDHIVQNLGLEQIGGGAELEVHAQAIIDANPDIVEKIKAGKDSAIQFLLGQVMARTKGKASAEEVAKLLRDKIGL
jgi:aspartyl-tRNA(Asn)/glutamyl-tRNA(Gln) amidotransferase subunit B